MFFYSNFVLDVVFHCRMNSNKANCVCSEAVRSIKSSTQQQINQLEDVNIYLISPNLPLCSLFPTLCYKIFSVNSVQTGLIKPSFFAETHLLGQSGLS